MTESLSDAILEVSQVPPGMLVADEVMAKSTPTTPESPASDAAAAKSDAEPEYTIDELATVSRVPSRTIRFYQSAGALPKPVIKGRVAYYGRAHLERLEHIAMLQDRGLQIKAIRSVVEQAEKGEFSIQEWLGFHDQLNAPWVGDRPKVLSETELQTLLKEHRPGLAAELLRANAMERRGDSFLINSPALFDLALRLERAGVTVGTARAATVLIEKHLARLASELTEFYLERGEDLEGAYEELRPVSIEAVRILFAREMERAIRKANESGAASALTKRKRTKKK